MKKLFSTTPVAFHSGIAIARVITGFFMAYHGFEVFQPEAMKVYFDWNAFKGIFPPEFSVYAGKTAELVAGILLMLGLFTRIACLLMMGTLAFIAFFVGKGQVWYGDQHPFMFVLIGWIFIITGPGKYSLDEMIYRRNSSGA